MDEVILANLLEESVSNLNEESGIMFSGGIDSSLIAFLAKKHMKINGYVVGKKDAHDINAAKSASSLIGLNLVMISIDVTDVEEGIKKLLDIDNSMDALEVSYDLPLYFVSKEAEEEVILSGQGSDEIFGGYQKYRKPNVEERMLNDIDILLKRTYPREKKIASYFSNPLIAPFLTDEIVEFSKSLDLEEKISEESNKIILRKSAKHLGLPTEIAERKKKAAQYGSGITRLMKKVAKKHDMQLREFVESLK